ncbi:ADP-ribosylglycohydrolase family protein [Mucilaginibacter robiniae]|uniref:ADP-ribosylglycohydrolase family protein n=1 Tax=Mucilaginibacter robiniae TaxID=2728022 RepID=A0A7L5E589_9SPHI|nr:ADP-ribosylglycohydrolase family protein [Mucilaginibacter robiniae]QJD97788.1 ADP-ribosylglycohydrolase family protein [Mucilaginibacter robiniae]
MEFFLNTCKSLLLGVAVGDALGVPVEFKSRAYLKQYPVTNMTGYGSHHQPAGTFSDDASLTFCLAEGIVSGFDLKQIAQNFINWRNHSYWTATHEVFDIGITTQRAIDRLVRGVAPELAGDEGENANGNGSLMRILPLLVNIKDKPVAERFEIIKKVSSVTHRHIRTVIACFYYLEFALQILQGKQKMEVYLSLQKTFPDTLIKLFIPESEIAIFIRLLVDRINMIGEGQIYSSGYVVHTLEASIWCLLTTNTYAEATLKAVNLGEDTDTTAAVTGGLAGLLYGLDGIPQKWLLTLARRDDIEELALRLFNKIHSGGAF